MAYKFIHSEYSICMAALNFIFGTAIVSVFANVLNLSLSATLLVAFWNIFLKISSTGLNINFRLKDLRIFFFSVVLVFFYFFLQIDDRSIEKIVLILYNILLPIFVLLLLYSKNSEKSSLTILLRKSISNQLIIFSSISLFLFLVFRVNGKDGRYVLPGLENPIWLGRHFGGLIISMLLLKPKTDSIYRLVGYIFLVSSLFFILLTIQARGPIFATILVVVYIFIQKLKLSPMLGRIGKFMTFILVLLSTYTAYVILLHANQMHSMIIRIVDLQKIEMFDLLTFNGNGLGSWGLIVLGIDERSYPHNMIVEILFEFGILGFGLFLIWSFKFMKTRLVSLFYFLATYYFLLSMVSGDLPGNNYFFISSCASILVAQSHRKTHNYLI